MEQPGVGIRGMVAGMEPFFSEEDTERRQEEFNEVYGGEGPGVRRGRRETGKERKRKNMIVSNCAITAEAKNTLISYS